jgi:hypothetical protein
MRRLVCCLAVACAFGFALAGGCVNVSWVAGVRCDGESCPAGLTCCSGRCYASCGSTAREPDATGAGGAPSAFDAGNMSVDASAGTGGIGGVSGFGRFVGGRSGFGASGAGNFFGGPRPGTF